MPGSNGRNERHSFSGPHVRAWEDKDTQRTQEHPFADIETSSGIVAVKAGISAVGTAGRAVQHKPVVTATRPMPDGAPRQTHTALLAVPFDGWIRELDDGRLRTRTYTSRDGEEKTITELLAQSVIFLGGPRTNEDREEHRPQPGKPRSTDQSDPRRSSARERNRRQRSEDGGVQGGDVPF